LVGSAASAGGAPGAPEPALSARGVRRVAAFGALAVLLLALLAAWQLYRQVAGQREADARRAVQTLEEHAQKVIGGHLALLEQVEWLVRDVGWEAATENRVLHDRMRAMTKARPEVQSIWLFDDEGNVKATSIGFPAPDANFADRDYFQAALGGEHRIVGQVVFGRITREYNFSLAVRMTGAEGRFLGLLLISLYPDYFRSFYGDIVDAGDTAMLLRADGALLARHPQPGGEPPELRAPETLMRRLAAASEGVLRTTAAFEAREFVHAYRRLPDLPLYVVYGVARERILGEWLELVGLYALLAVPALAGVGVLGWTAHRQALAADRSREALRLANIELERRVDARTVELQDSERRARTLALEVDHRAKNLLAAVQSIVTLTRAEDVRGYVRSLSGRLTALARAQALLSESRWTGASLERLAREELAAYDTGRAGRVALSGEDFALAAAAAQGVSMVLHELATNAAKYGALSAAEGGVVFEWAAGGDGRTVLRWSERGGPLASEPRRKGFGAGLIETTCAQQLGGEVRFDWRPEGLSVEMLIPDRNLRGAD